MTLPATLSGHRDAAQRPHSSTLVMGRVDPVETILVCFTLVIYMGTLRSILFGAGEGDREGGSFLSQVTLLSIYGSTIGLLLMRGMPSWFGKLIVKTAPLLLLTFYAVISASWSDAPAVTIRRGIALLLTMMFAYYVVTRFSAREFLNILALAFAVFMVIGVMAIAVPGEGITPGGPYAGAWQGFTGNKNEFGRTLGLMGALMLVCRGVGVELIRKHGLAMVAFAFLLLILAKSKTPLVAATAAVCGCIALRLVLHGRMGDVYVSAFVRAFLVVFGLIFGALMLVYGLPIILELLGRDPTLSGRTKLWEYAIGIGSEHPWRGAGYRSFWIDSNTLYFFEYFSWRKNSDGTKSDNFAGPSHGHSGYLDLWLELGFIGWGLFLLIVATALRRLTLCYRTGGRMEATFHATVLSFILIYSVTAKGILQQAEDMWFLFMVSYFYITIHVMSVTRPAPRYIPPGLR